MGCSASIKCYPAKIPHFVESLKILAFYAILPSTPLIACESFMEALLSGFQRVVCRLALPSNRWRKRPTPNAARRYPPFKSSTAARSCSYGLFPWAALLRFAFGFNLPNGQSEAPKPLSTAIRFTSLDHLQRRRIFESRVRGTKPLTNL